MTFEVLGILAIPSHFTRISLIPPQLHALFLYLEFRPLFKQLC